MTKCISLLVDTFPGVSAPGVLLKKLEEENRRKEGGECVDAVAEPAENDTLTNDSIMTMNVTELREHMKARNLRIGGRKAELQERLKVGVDKKYSFGN